MSRYGLAALAVSLCFAAQMLPAFAEGPVTYIDGKRYVQNGDRLYPQVKNEWESMDGVTHVNWITDYSTYRAPITKPIEGVKSAPIAVKTPPTATSSKIDSTANITVKDNGTKHYLTIGADALFDFDKATLNPKAEKALQTLGPMIVRYGRYPAVIEGHTDSIGSEEYNQTLSEQRASSVKKWLVDHGFVSDSADTIGYGKRNPVAPNSYLDGSDFPQGRAKNRRVTIYINAAEERSDKGT